MPIFKFNESALVAMVGKNCFAIASDRRLGVQLQTIVTDFQRIYKVHDKVSMACVPHKLYQLREERDMKPETFASLVSAILCEKRLLPTKDIQAVVEGGCPNLLGKAVNSAKRLRVHVGLGITCILQGSCVIKLM